MRTVLRIHDNGYGRTGVPDYYMPRDGEIIIPPLSRLNINCAAKIEARRLFNRYGRFGYVSWLDVSGAVKLAGLSPQMVSFADEHKIGERAKVILSRVRQRAEYLAEIAPAWQPVREIYYADNSVCVEQVALDGRRREKMVTAPHGDVC